MPQTIPTGPYFGFTKAELAAELIRYKQAVRESSSRLTGASVDGQSFSFGPRGDMTLEQWQVTLQSALAYFGEADDPPGNQTAGSFATSA